MNNNKKLTRSSSDYILFGVLGGLARYFGINSTLLRVGYVILSFLSIGFPGVLVYILLLVLMPSDNASLGSRSKVSGRKIINGDEEDEGKKNN